MGEVDCPMHNSTATVSVAILSLALIQPSPLPRVLAGVRDVLVDFDPEQSQFYCLGVLYLQGKKLWFQWFKLTRLQSQVIRSRRQAELLLVLV